MTIAILRSVDAPGSGYVSYVLITRAATLLSEPERNVIVSQIVWCSKIGVGIAGSRMNMRNQPVLSVDGLNSTTE